MSAQGSFCIFLWCCGPPQKEQGSVGLPKRGRFALLETIPERARFTQLAKHARKSKVHYAPKRAQVNLAPTRKEQEIQVIRPQTLRSTCCRSKIQSVNQSLSSSALVRFRTQVAVFAEFTFLGRGKLQNRIHSLRRVHVHSAVFVALIAPRGLFVVL